MIKMADWFLFGIAALIFYGFWGFLPKLAINFIEPRSVLIFEISASFFLVLLLLVSVNFKPEIHPKGLSFAILAGIAGALGTLFFLYSLSKGKASVVVTMTALYPLIAIILSFFILKEPLTIKQGVGIVLALLAMIFLSF